MHHLALVAFGGALGALARYGIGGLFAHKFATNLIGTFAVNLSGSFFLGLFVGFGFTYFHWSPEIRNLVTVGFLGSYTTFSTLSVATIQLIGKGEVFLASVNIIATVVCGLSVATLGIFIGRTLSPP